MRLRRPQAIRVQPPRGLASWSACRPPGRLARCPDAAFFLQRLVASITSVPRQRYRPDATAAATAMRAVGSGRDDPWRVLVSAHRFLQTRQAGAAVTRAGEAVVARARYSTVALAWCCGTGGASAARTTSAIGLQANQSSKASTWAGAPSSRTCRRRRASDRVTRPSQNSIERHDVGRDRHIDVEARVLETDRNVPAVDQEPIAPPRPAPEIELDHHAPSADRLDTHTAPHPPQQNDRIELVSPRLAESPACSPSAELVDDRLQLAPGRCQAVFGPLAPRGAAPLQHAGLLQPPQPLREQGAGHVRKAALELVEVINVGEKLADDEDGPAVGEDLRRTRHGAVLAVPVHDRRYHAGRLPK